MDRAFGQIDATYPKSIIFSVSVFGAGIVSAEIEAAMTPPTQQGGDTPAVVTGDTALIVMIVCLVSLLGMGIALKARRA